MSMSVSALPEARAERARRSLDGLSVGDGFGDRFFAFSLRHRLERSLAPGPPWPVTDDSIMACAIVEYCHS